MHHVKESSASSRFCTSQAHPDVPKKPHMLGCGAEFSWVKLCLFIWIHSSGHTNITLWQCSACLDRTALREPEEMSQRFKENISQSRSIQFLAYRFHIGTNTVKGSNQKDVFLVLFIDTFIHTPRRCILTPLNVWHSQLASDTCIILADNWIVLDGSCPLWRSTYNENKAYPRVYLLLSGTAVQP